MIARDNGDNTYRVEFDDGDVEERAPHCDIRVIPQTEARADDSNLPRDEVRVRDTALPNPYSAVGN